VFSGDCAVLLHGLVLSHDWQDTAHRDVVINIGAKRSSSLAFEHDQPLYQYSDLVRYNAVWWTVGLTIP
jgi:hypothetical protein